MAWEDERLQWDQFTYDGLVRILDDSLIWQPDSYFFNVADMHEERRRSQCPPPPPHLDPTGTSRSRPHLGY